MFDNIDFKEVSYEITIDNGKKVNVILGGVHNLNYIKHIVVKECGYSGSLILGMAIYSEDVYKAIS